MEVFLFLESLANSSFFNFNQIKVTDGIENLLESVEIEPKNYMQVIYSLTNDLIKADDLNEFNDDAEDKNKMSIDQVLTEFGICFSANNILSSNLSTLVLLENKISKSIDSKIMKANLYDGRTTYKFQGYGDFFQIFVHSPYETMNIARPFISNNLAGVTIEVTVRSAEIITTNDFRETTISQRGCRFHSESNLTNFKVYTKNLCMSQCRIDLALEMCQCIPHYYAFHYTGKLEFIKLIFK